MLNSVTYEYYDAEVDYVRLIKYYPYSHLSEAIVKEYMEDVVEGEAALTMEYRESARILRQGKRSVLITARYKTCMEGNILVPSLVEITRVADSGYTILSRYRIPYFIVKDAIRWCFECDIEKVDMFEYIDKMVNEVCKAKLEVLL